MWVIVDCSAVTPEICAFFVRTVISLIEKDSSLRHRKFFHDRYCWRSHLSARLSSHLEQTWTSSYSCPNVKDVYVSHGLSANSLMVSYAFTRIWTMQVRTYYGTLASFAFSSSLLIQSCSDEGQKSMWHSSEASKGKC